MQENLSCGYTFDSGSLSTGKGMVVIVIAVIYKSVFTVVYILHIRERIGNFGQNYNLQVERFYSILTVAVPRTRGRASVLAHTLKIVCMYIYVRVLEYVYVCKCKCKCVCVCVCVSCVVRRLCDPDSSSESGNITGEIRYVVRELVDLYVLSRHRPNYDI